MNFDQFGAGQVCSSKGSTLLSASSDGSGFRANSKGLVVSRWTTAGEVTPQKTRGLDATDPLGQHPEARVIKMRISDTLGVVYNVATRSVEVWFQCRGIVHKFCQGHNPAQPTSAVLPAEFAPRAAGAASPAKKASPGRRKQNMAGGASASAAPSMSPVTHAQTLADIRAAVSSL